MSATALALLGLPSILLAEKTIFLPPKGGWLPRDMCMREVQQYLINNDAIQLRFDMAWKTLKGDIVQYHVQTPSLFELSYQSGIFSTPEILRSHRESARSRIAQEIPFGAQMVQLPLPQSAYRAAYV